MAGTVAAVGPAVTRFAVGDEVFGIAHGSFAEYAAAREDTLARRPAALSFEQASAVAVSGLTESDLAIDSPYNTRLHTGLPPTPICNPGLASLQAAAHPAHVNYLYYVAKPNGCGHYFTASYSAFQQASARYNSARNAAGGKSPTNCP